MDTGTHDSLLDAGNFVRTLTNRLRVLVGSPDVLAYNMGWIGELKTKDYIQKNRIFEYPKPLHSPKWDQAADNITYLEKIAKSNNRTRDASDCITTNDLMENYLLGWQGKIG